MLAGLKVKVELNATSTLNWLPDEGGAVGTAGAEELEELEVADPTGLAGGP
jgi:hypothetical protein